jgi:hypothetical protein
VADRIVAVRLAASSIWLMGDPSYEPKARGINELPMRFDPGRHANFGIGTLAGLKHQAKKLLPWCLNNSDPEPFC